MKNKKRYTIRVFDWNKTEDYMVGDEVLSACYKGVVIGWTDAKNGQIKVLVENGDIEDWVNPDKGDRHFDVQNIFDLLNIVFQMACEGSEE